MIGGAATYIRLDMSDPFSLDDDYSPPSAQPPQPPVGEPPYLAALNPGQREAVEALEGPVLVLAGAGTGKTRVLTSRLAHLLATGRAWPRQVLAVTFTNKAAREMRERVMALVGPAAEGIWLGTFHALGTRILRRHAELVGLKPNFTILDADDQIRLLKQLLQAENIDAGRWPARALMGIIQRWKDRGLTPDRVGGNDEVEFANGRGRALYAEYQDRLRSLNAADFGDLLLHDLTIFSERPDILTEWQRRFRYILVDEYQDTNVAQYLWLRLLAQSHRNLCCVGDDDQSIYGWRGAEVGNILRFERDFPGARVIRLEQNYRSTPHILGAASGLIANNEGRLGKTLWTDRPMGSPVKIRCLWDGDEEARFVGDEIEALQRTGHQLREIAILVRAGFQTRAFEERFVTLGLPYRVVGGPRFYERQEIRDAIAYLRVVVQPDDDLAMERIVNVPRRGIGNATIQAIHRLARAERLSFLAAAQRIVTTDEITGRARNSLTRLLKDFARWRAQLGVLSHVELTEIVLDESGYTEMWQHDRSPEAPGRLENLKELVRAIAEFESLQAFLEHVSLVMDNEDNLDADMINLMTLHSAKGLEFDTVFLPGWEEGLFPHQRALDENGIAGLEEERRLAYVGLTRARRRAIVSCAANRRVHNLWQNALPSRFIAELPEAHVERVNDTGLSGGFRAAGAGRAAADYAYADSVPAGGPGFMRWKDAQQRGRVIEGRAWEVSGRPSDGKGSFRVGDRVFHQRFGYGRVEQVDDDRLEISFEKAGRKTVLGSFVEQA